VKFYSVIANKPHAIMDGFRMKDGIKVAGKQLCTFINGELETDNPEIIKRLQARPELFRADHPWNPVGDKVVGKVGNKVEFELLKYKELLIKAKEAGINTYKMKKEAIVKALNEKGSELNGIS